MPGHQNAETSMSGPATEAEPQRRPAKAAGLRERWWVRALVLVGVMYGTWCGVLYFYQGHMLFPADMAPQPLARPLPARLAGKIVVCRIDVPGGQNEAWFLPAPGASAARPGPAVVFCHGNAEIIDYQDDIVRSYHRLGVSVLLPEFRGYGVAPGRPSEKAFREDNVRFYDWLVTRPEVDPKRIVFHGRSLGGGVACDLATQRTPAAMILESTFFSAAVMAHNYLAPAFLCRHPFRNDRALARTTFPVLVGHGTRDQIIPVSHGRSLRDLPGRGVVYIEYDCDHNGFPGAGNGEDWWGRVRKFLVGAGALER
jgi:hypothetical protein